MYKYAFAVQLEENSNLFEIFDIILINQSSNNEMINRWKKGFLNGNVTLLKNNNVEKISENSFWDGEKFIFNNNFKSFEYYNKNLSIVLLSNNYVFGLINLPEDQYVKDKYEAALDSNVIGIDISNIDNVELGSIWNGTEFIN